MIDLNPKDEASALKQVLDAHRHILDLEDEYAAAEKRVADLGEQLNQARADGKEVHSAVRNFLKQQRATPATLTTPAPTLPLQS